MKGRHEPVDIVRIEKADIDELAWESKPMPENARTEDLIYYHMVRSVYGVVKYGGMSIDDAKHMKRLLAHYFEYMEQLALSGGRLICALDRLTAPQKDLSGKSREELLEIVVRMQALCSGMIKNAEAEIPERLRRSEQ